MSKRQRQTQPPNATPTVYADILSTHREIGIVSTVDGDCLSLRELYRYCEPIPQGRRVRILIVDAEGDDGSDAGTSDPTDHAGVSPSE